eukprot:scaffold164324_cov27-Tisochrysis_lutea.AAC.3
MYSARANNLQYGEPSAFARSQHRPRSPPAPVAAHAHRTLPVQIAHASAPAAERSRVVHGPYHSMRIFNVRIPASLSERLAPVRSTAPFAAVR